MARFKKVSAAVLVLCLVFSFSTATAAQKGVIYNSTTSNYTAQKLSHPNSGPGEIDGIIKYESGENDRGQNYSWSAVGYGDYMYVGTCYAAIYTTLKIIAQQNGMSMETFTATMNALYNGTLYMGDSKNNPDDANRSVIIKFNVKTGEAKIVDGPNKFGGFRAAIEFNDKLYFCSTAAAPYLLEIDPENNDSTKKVYTCEKPSDPFISVSIRGLTVLGDKLIASMIGDNGAYIVASENPSEGQESFKVIGTQEDLLNYPAYHYNDSIFGGSIWDMVSFNNKLYISVVTGKNGNKQAFALFCGEEDKNTGEWKFRLLVGDKNDGAKYTYGLGADRSGAANLVVHDNHLYIGGYNDPMIALPAVLNMDFEELYKDLASPVNLWRMDTNENFELVAGEPNALFPKIEGNFGAGLGSNLNQYIWRMESYDGKLFVGTFDIGSLAYPLMQLTNGDILKLSPAELKTQIEYIKELHEILTKNSAEGVAVVNDDITENIYELYNTMSKMTSIIGEGGISDLKDSEEFLSLLKLSIAIYERVREHLPEYVTQQLDKLFSEENAENFYYFIGVCNYLREGERGFDLLVSDDGVNFDVITRNGFGDPYNHGLRVFAITDEGLCIGTANPFYGTQLWKISERENNGNLGNDDSNNTTTNPPTEEPSDGTEKPPADNQQSNKPNVDVPDTGDSATSIAILFSVLTAGVVLTLLSSKKKIFN